MNLFATVYSATLTGLDTLRSFNFSQLMDRLSTPSSRCHLGLCLTVCAMNCPFRYRDGAVIFLVVVGDLLQEEKLVALPRCRLVRTYSRQSHLPDSTFRYLELDLVFTSVEQSPRAFNHASLLFVMSTHVLDQFNLEVHGNDSIVLCHFGSLRPPRLLP
jgi:hypothetical protein